MTNSAVRRLFHEQQSQLLFKRRQLYNSLLQFFFLECSGMTFEYVVRFSTFFFVEQISFYRWSRFNMIRNFKGCICIYDFMSFYGFIVFNLCKNWPVLTNSERGVKLYSTSLLLKNSCRIVYRFLTGTHKLLIYHSILKQHIRSSK